MVILRVDPAERVSWYNSEYTLSTLVASILVQSFFSWRIKKAIGMWVALPLILLILLEFGFGLGVYIRAQIHADALELPEWDRNSIIGWSATQVVIDILIASIMIVELHRNRTGTPRMDREILIRNAIQGSIATSILAMTMLFPYVLYGMHFLHMWSVAALGGVYPIYLLANLHARSQARQYLILGSAVDVEQPQSIDLPKVPSEVNNWDSIQPPSACKVKLRVHGLSS
ncbi:uncharacterized protein EI90DRAFT_3064566 [Cantharellus anzutake]|uniref:uncharacterized protein n=1 Tax=Cantharellus anzutake TaxID=1750568 RepID=UPI001905E2C7|nr:uncharacterized protein EI90DRAFT_3064566 [Cantharellus anzutake]KAF8328555.1 hypothetical protein EI90DRAFT_3064566 [Cantharellus anzutake]